jgi:hypothetical protein
MSASGTLRGTRITSTRFRGSSWTPSGHATLRWRILVEQADAAIAERIRQLGVILVPKESPRDYGRARLRPADPIQSERVSGADNVRG